MVDFAPPPRPRPHVIRQVMLMSQLDMTSITKKALVMIYKQQDSCGVYHAMWYTKLCHMLIGVLRENKNCCADMQHSQCLDCPVYQWLQLTMEFFPLKNAVLSPSMRLVL
jgi:hypothetical protein